VSEARASLRVHVLRPLLARVPQYATEGAAGLDLSAALEAPLTLAPGARAAIPTGLAIALPASHEGQVRPRSGLAIAHGVTVLNAPGTIDEDYRGEIKVLLINSSAEPYTIAPGERIAQLVVAKVTRIAVECVAEVEDLGETERGARGFGSSGR
jgi:dUTP pyrophosphatase